MGPFIIHQDVALSVSIVTFRPDLGQLGATIRSLAQAGQACDPVIRLSLTLIDNTPGEATSDDMSFRQSLNTWFGDDVQLVRCPENPGFGVGHNRGLSELGRYHLILNPDVELQTDALSIAMSFMTSHLECGLLAPVRVDAEGRPQSLCKRYPSVLVLLLRGFAPRFVRALFPEQLAQYEMRDKLSSDVLWDPPIISGCFMLFRSEVLNQLGGFDPRFFLYFEDDDISLRTGAISRIARVPQVRIIHHGGHAARKGLRHIAIFARSAVKFFSKHGWSWL